MSRQKSMDSVDEILRGVKSKAKADLSRSNQSDNQVDDILASLGIGDKVTGPRRGRARMERIFEPTMEIPKVEIPVPEQEPEMPAVPVQEKQPETVLPAKRESAVAVPIAAPEELPPQEPTEPEEQDVIHGFFNNAKDSGVLEDPSELLRREERFRKVFGESVTVIPGQHSHAMEDTDELDPAPVKKKWFSLFGRRKAEEVMQESLERLEPVEIEDYVFGGEEEEPLPVTPVAGQQFLDATQSVPKIDAEEKKRAWSVSIDLPTSRDASYTSAWAKAETRRESSLQFDKPATTGQVMLNIPAREPEKPESTGTTGQVVLTVPQEAAPVPPAGKKAKAAPAEKDQKLELSPEQKFVANIANNINGDSLELEPVPEIEQLSMEEAAASEEPGMKNFAARLMGTPEDEEAEQELFEAPAQSGQDMEDDYNKPEDAPGVAADLADMVFHLRVRTAVSGFIALVLLYLALSAEGFLPAVAALDPAYAPQAYLAANLLGLVIAGLMNYRTLSGGLQGLIGQPNPDSMSALATVAAGVQAAVLLAAGNLYRSGEMTVYAGVAVLLLCFNSLGKQISSRVVRDNFDLVSSGVDHSAAYRLRDVQLVRQLADGLELPKPDLLLSRPTVLVRGFLTNSFSQRKSDKAAKSMSLLLLGTAAAAGIINLLLHKNSGEAVTMFTAVFCLGGPLSATLISALPDSRLQAHAARVGAVVPGWNSIRQLGSVNTIQVSSGDLFPAGSIKLHGIKTFAQERIDLAILYAASILVEGCDTLRSVFLNMLQNDRRLLLPVENLTSEIGAGFVGWIKKNRVIVGNRYMMEKYEIDLPDLEFEQQYTREGRRPIYLAVSGKLFGMFIVSYAPNPEALDALTSLNAGGVNFLVTGTDFLVDAELIEDTYGLMQNSVKLLNAEESDSLAPAIAWLSESEGCMIHMGGFASYAGGILAAWGAAKGERYAALTMQISVAVSCLLCLGLCAFGSVSGLGVVQLLMYHAAWTAITLALPVFQRYR